MSRPEKLYIFFVIMDSRRGQKMCEFDVIVDGEKVFEEAVYLRREDKNGFLMRDILGQEEKFDGVTIEEMDVSSEKLILSKR